MAPTQAFVPLPDSDREPLGGATSTGSVDSGAQVEITVVVRPRPGGDPRAAAAALATQPPGARTVLSREEFARQHGALDTDLEAVADYARSTGISVAWTDASRRSVGLVGPAGAMGAAFGVTLERFELPSTSSYRSDSGRSASGVSTASVRAYRGHRGPVHIPAHLDGIVQAVLGFDDRPQAQPRLAPLVEQGGPAALATSYTAPTLAQLYAFPTSTDGSGQTIALIELGGGFDNANLQTYFSSLGLTPPRVIAVGVDGGSNQPTGSPTGPDGEVQLDIEVAGAVAPGATIVAYFAPNTDRGFLDAITTALHSTSAPASVISISWGGPESSWTNQAMQSFDQAFADAATLGVTVCVASGDRGSGDGVGDGLAHVDFPASSPHALGCGGTSLHASGGTITSETVWNDASGAGGGGVSAVFPLPVWQQHANVPVSANPGAGTGRGVPDVAGDADPATGYRVRVDGTDTVYGGTSAVAPLWAGLVALLNASMSGPVGYLNPTLYGLGTASGVTRDITQGNNGAYQATTGWDACTGWGSPIGSALLAALLGSPTGHNTPA